MSRLKVMSIRAKYVKIKLKKKHVSSDTNADSIPTIILELDQSKCIIKKKKAKQYKLSKLTY